MMGALVQKLLDVELFARKRRSQKFANLDDSHDVLDRAASHRQQRMMAVAQHRYDLFVRVLKIDPHDVGARRHDRAHRPVAKPQHGGDHAPLVALDHARGRSFGDQRLDLFFRDGRLLAGVAADEAEHEPGRGIQQPDDGRGDAREHVHGRRDGARDPLGIAQREILGNQFADHDREIGDQPDHDGVADCGRRERAQPVFAKCVGEHVGQRRAGKHAGENADHGDADLDGRQEAARILGQPEGDRRAAPAVLGHHLQPGFARGHDREFGQREHPVKGDQEGRNGKL